MSLSQNTEWIESAYDMFEQALAIDNIALAKDIITDTFEYGFADESRKMNQELRAWSEVREY